MTDLWRVVKGTEARIPARALRCTIAGFSTALQPISTSNQKSLSKERSVQQFDYPRDLPRSVWLPGERNYSLRVSMNL
jgi:hypothetical protein